MRCRLLFCIGMRNPTKSAIFLVMEMHYYLPSWLPGPGQVRLLHKTQPFCPFSMENFPWITLPGRIIRFIFMGNQPFFGNGEAMELPAQGCRITAPDEPRNRLGMWRWRMHATWEPLIASRNLKRDHRGGVPAVRAKRPPSSRRHVALTQWSV